MPKNVRIALAALAVAVAAVTGSTLTSGDAAAAGTGCPPPITVAHRGENSMAPEQTPPAIVAALKGGANAIEFDVRHSNGGVPVLMHDSTVDRTTNGTGAVSSLTLTQLKALDAGSWFSGVYKGTRIPTFVEALRLIRPYSGVYAIPELKSTVSQSRIDVLEKNIADNGMNGRVVIQSFYPSSLKMVKQYAPTIPTALLTYETFTGDPVAAAKDAGAKYWFPANKNLTAAQVDAAHAGGLKVWPWTLNTPAEWTAAGEKGVDALMTDKAARYEGWALATCGVAP